MNPRKPPVPCTYDGCERPAVARTWCKGCYERWRRAGQPDDGPPPPIEQPTDDARREDYAWLRSQGVRTDEAAARIGFSISYARALDRQSNRKVST